MGRRSINTTKSGKYMNPTDQARKEARKKELKKNKKQRQMVRAAVLKGKDPQQLILDLEKIDQMEYNVLQPSPLNEKVLKDKRKKLRDTLERVLKMYNKDDPDKWAELKRLQVDYERKRATLYNYYESVKNAQQVQVDDIPLPIAALPAELQAVFVGIPSQIPLPTRAPQQPVLRHHPIPQPFLQHPHHSILKKTSAYNKISEKAKEPPGVPPGPPPELTDDEEEVEPVISSDTTLHETLVSASQINQKKSIRFADDDVDDDDDDDDDDEEDDEGTPEKERSKSPEEDKSSASENESEEEDEIPKRKSPEPDDKPRPTTLQQKMLAMAGQDIDQFMKEMEEVHKKRKADRAADLESRLQALEQKTKASNKREASPPPAVTPAPIVNNPPVQLPINIPTPESIPVPPIPGPRPNMNIPPGIPPPLLFRPPPPRGVPALMGIRLPPGPPPGLPPRLGMRLPPGPPPGMPPRLIRPPTIPPVTPILPPPTNVLSAAPQLINRPQDKTGATIQAQAQIRNLSADVTRFLPTALRVRRDTKQRKDIKGPQLPEPKPEVQPPPPANVQTKDDAYQQFMREMEGLL